MKIGYLRISSKTQNLDRQIETMRKKGIEERFLFQDIASGKNFERPGYQAMKKILREGDCLYIDSIDRLGRDYTGIIEEWKYITRVMNCDIVAIDNEALFDSRKFKQMGDVGKLMEDQFLSLLAYVADTERKKTLQRQKEGIAAAKNKGVKFGRPLSISDWDLFDETAQRWCNGEITAVEACKITGSKKTSFYKYIQARGFKKPKSVTD